MTNIGATLLLLAFPSLIIAQQSPAEKVPIIFSTDLFHPPHDPDDTFDLATLFALKEFDLRGVILDNVRGDQKTRSGRIPLEQMMHLTRRQVKCAAGLPVPLESSTDQGQGQPREYQGGVELILSCLRETKEKVVLFSTGSCRDIAAAFNRDPTLFRDRVKAVYSVIGNGGNGEAAQFDYNSRLDPWAYFRLFEIGVPFFWCTTRPKMTEEKIEGPYSTNYLADQGKVLPALSRQVQNFFVYCLTRSTADPLAFLDSGPHPLPGGPRHMWSTGPLCHAAGRNIYQRSQGDFVVLRPDDAARAGLAEKRTSVFEFVPMAVKLKSKEPKAGQFGPYYTFLIQQNPDTTAPNALGFHRLVEGAAYRQIMESVLTNLLAELK